MEKKKINYTKNNVLDLDEIDSKNVKIFISNQLDEDVLKAVK